MDAISERRRKLSGKKAFKTTSAVGDVWIEAVHPEYTAPDCARGQTGKGANRTLFGGAFKALCSGRTNRGWLFFPDSFSLVRFFWRGKRNEQ